MAQPKKILLFDDNYDSLLPLKEFLESVCGYQVDLTAEKSILKQVSTTCYDLVIVDRMIARNGLDEAGQKSENLYFEGIHWEQTGTEFLRRLRQGDFQSSAESGTAQDVPAIILSAVGDNASRETLETSEHTQYMDKPFDLDELVDVLDKLLKESES